MMKTLNKEIETSKFCVYEFTDRSKNYSCNCIGEQNGEPLCPCQMREQKIFKHNGEWIQPRKVIGRVK